MNAKFHPKILVLFGARTLGLFKISRYLTRSQLRILCYHGGVIGDEHSYNPKLFCSADTLGKRMKWMQARGFQFVSLDEGVKQQTRAAACAPLRTVVTFDDGWYSTASELLPVLSKLKIPSTLYLSTQNFLEGWPILTVTVRYTMWKAGPRTVTMRNWGRGVDGEYALRDPAERNRLARQVVAAIQDMASGREQICAALDRFAEDLGVPASALQIESRRFDYLTPQELAGIQRMGCSIESHGHVHDYPKGQPLEFAADLRQCEDVIVGLGLERPRHYCYPSGEFGDEASKVLGDMGIRSATTCVPGLIGVVDQKRCHYLPRFLDGEDVHQLEFEAEMSGFTELLRNAIRFVRRPLGVLQSDLQDEYSHAEI
jgi:peptidoglycan/xylan/chitin deacetylase (PgdA/CDA1 family)